MQTEINNDGIYSNTARHSEIFTQIRTSTPPEAQVVMRIESQKNLSLTQGFVNKFIGWPMAANLLTGALLVYLIPNCPPSVQSFAYELAELVRQMIPASNRFINQSQLPNNTKSLIPLFYIFSFVLLFQFWSNFKFLPGWGRSFWTHPWKNGIRLFLLIALAPLFFKVAYQVGGYDIAPLSIKDSKLLLALMGGLYCGGGAWLVISMITTTIYLLSRKHHEHTDI